MPSRYQILTRYNYVHEVLQDIVKRPTTFHETSATSIGANTNADGQTDNKHYSTTLVICSTREEFLHQLVACITLDKHNSNGNHNDTAATAAAAEGNDDDAPLPLNPPLNETITTTTTTTDEIPASQEDIDNDHTNNKIPTLPTTTTPTKHHKKKTSSSPSTGSRFPQSLTTPTLQLLSSSRTTRTVFCPTIAIFRAYMSVYHPHQKEKLLQIVDLIHLHHGTSEFTLQGLSHTLSGVVSAGHRNQIDQIKLVECEDVMDPDHPYRGKALWDVNVPLLSGSVKLNSGAAVAGWGARTVSVRKVVGRWFDFDPDPDFDPDE